MSWERTDFVSTDSCPCGHGVIERKYYEEDDDWNRSRSGIISETIMCPDCIKTYHIEHIVRYNACPKWKGDVISDVAYCVPNGMTVQGFDTDFHKSDITYSFEERIVSQFSKEDLMISVEDMKVKKFSTRITDEKVQSVMHSFQYHCNTKRFKILIPEIEAIIADYDKFVVSYQNTKAKIDAYNEEEQQRIDAERSNLSDVLANCKVLNFTNRKAI